MTQNYAHASRILHKCHELCTRVMNCVHVSRTLQISHELCTWTTAYINTSRTLHIHHGLWPWVMNYLDASRTLRMSHAHYRIVSCGRTDHSVHISVNKCVTKSTHTSRTLFMSQRTLQNIHVQSDRSESSWHMNRLRVSSVATPLESDLYITL